MALNYYRLLGIPPDADQQRIRTVYRSLAKRFHPDTNRGSEAAAELFRQVNTAYRILSDPASRASYDRKLEKQQSEERKREAATKPLSPSDPQQKFNRFLNSLLDALFGPLDEQAGVTQAEAQRPATGNQQRRGKPAFNFYYHLALEKDPTPYTCGADGVYRRASRRKPENRRSKR